MSMDLYLVEIKCSPGQLSIVRAQEMITVLDMED